LIYIPYEEYIRFVKLVRIYECLCDATRLRLLNLLSRGPLCVCHVQKILDEPQAKISKHLSYLKTRGMVEVKRDGNWMIYQLPKKRSPELDANLRCLQDCAQEDALFARDLARLQKTDLACTPVANVRRVRKPCC
jgi:ArsR family transcriptional regulator